MLDFKKSSPMFAIQIYTVVVAQLVRASVCGTEGRGFESHHPPQKGFRYFLKPFFYAFHVNTSLRL